MVRTYKPKNNSVEHKRLIYSMNGSSKLWSKRRKDKLKRLIKNNSVSVIAKIMKCGRGAIAGQIRRMKPNG